MKYLLRLPDRGEHEFTEVYFQNILYGQTVYELAPSTPSRKEAWAYGPFIKYIHTLYNPRNKQQFIGRPPFGVLTEEKLPDTDSSEDPDFKFGDPAW